MPLALLAMASWRVEAAPDASLESALRLAQAGDDAGAELLLDVSVNGQAPAQTVLVLKRSDGFWLPADTFQRARLRAPQAAARMRDGVAYYPLAAIAGARYAFDAAASTLAITAPADAFVPSTLASGARERPPPALPAPGGFVNYELFASRASGESSVAGQFEAGAFGPYGVVTTGLLAQGGSVHDTVRLDTTYTRDFPRRMETLRVGDTVSYAGAWGRAVRIGGIQYGTNFATQPGFVTFPTVAANGEAALPSTVDVFVNNALVAQLPVRPGPFSVTNVPTVSGSGSVQLVVRDLFGREQVISQPFYATAQLLAPGLAQYSVEAGFERRDFGVRSADYGSALASATYRRGLAGDVTAEARAEAMRDGVAAGVAVDWLARDAGVVHAAAAASHRRGDGDGALIGAGFERRTGIWTALAQAQWTSPSFRVAGASDDNPLPRLQASATIGAQLGRLGSLGVTWVEQDLRAGGDVRLLSVGYTVSLGTIGFLGLSAVKTLGGDGNVALTATLTVPLTPRDWLAVEWHGVRGGGDRDDATISLARSLPAGEGFGYRVLARTRSELTANLAYQNDVGSYALDATSIDGETGVRASLAGGAGLLAGRAFASRAVTESFGVVRVDDYEGVGIMVDNQPVARTGAGGYAVLPRLRAYDTNPIAIVQKDLPLDATVERLEVDAVPYYRSGVLIEFPIRRSRGATLRLRLDDGGDMPAGASVDVIGGEAGFPVALGGEAYVTGLGATNRLRATWKGRSCDFDVAMPPSRDPLPDLGVVACAGVAR